MTADFDEGWTGVEDSTGELKVHLPDDREYGVGFALDGFLLNQNQRVDTVANNADDWIAWHAANPALIVSEPTTAAIGPLPATAIDIRLSPSAAVENADCPAACVNLWENPKFDHPNGILGDDAYRLYLSDVTYGGADHLLWVVVEARDEAELASVIPTVDALLATVTVPAASAAN